MDKNQNSIGPLPKKEADAYKLRTSAPDQRAKGQAFMGFDGIKAGNKWRVGGPTAAAALLAMPMGMGMYKRSKRSPISTGLLAGGMTAGSMYGAGKYGQYLSRDADEGLAKFGKNLSKAGGLGRAGKMGMMVGGGVMALGFGRKALNL